MRLVYSALYLIGAVAVGVIALVAASFAIPVPDPDPLAPPVAAACGDPLCSCQAFRASR